MDIGEYLDQLEARSANLQKRFGADPSSSAATAINMAVAILPMARATIANLYTALDNLDKALQRWEAH
jgi:hypothetical protein